MLVTANIYDKDTMIMQTYRGYFLEYSEYDRFMKNIDLNNSTDDIYSFYSGHISFVDKIEYWCILCSLGKSKLYVFWNDMIESYCERQHEDYTYFTDSLHPNDIVNEIFNIGVIIDEH